MALTNPTPEDIRIGLEQNLKRSGIISEVTIEEIPDTSLSRFVAVSGQFDSMPYLDRQSLVWRIADALLPVEEQLRLIGNILTLGAREIYGTDSTNGAH